MRQAASAFTLHLGAAEVRREHVSHEKPRESDEGSA